jgi:hypothetical protein
MLHAGWEETMKLVCAWCVKDGKAGVLGDIEPLDDPAVTHGICPAHRQEIEAELIQAREAADRSRKEAEARRDEVEALRKKVDP